MLVSREKETIHETL